MADVEHWNFDQRGRVEEELDDEIRYHLDRQIQDNIAKGLSPEEARRAALRRFGGMEQRKEECRDARGVNVLENLARDVRYALRGLIKNPGFTCAAILTLSLGIGANSAVFTMVHSILLRLLPLVQSLTCPTSSSEGAVLRESCSSNFPIMFATAARTESDINSVALTTGLEIDEFNACLQKDRQEILRRIEQQRQLAQSLQLRGTPGFAIGVSDGLHHVKVLKVIRGSQPLDVFEEVLKPLLDESS